MESEYPDQLSLVDYITTFNDEKFRETLALSLEDKRTRFDQLTKSVSKLKIDLRILVEDIVTKFFPDEPKADQILKCFWFATWKLKARIFMPKLEDTGQQIKNLETALIIAKSQVMPISKSKKGVSEEEVLLANSISVKSFISTKIRRSNNKEMTLCPFHTEKTGSFVIFDDNSWRCFGCQVHGGGAIDFIKKLYGYGFIQAVKFLINKSS